MTSRFGVPLCSPSKRCGENEAGMPSLRLNLARGTKKPVAGPCGAAADRLYTPAFGQGHDSRSAANRSEWKNAMSPVHAIPRGPVRATQLLEPAHPVAICPENAA